MGNVQRTINVLSNDALINLDLSVFFDTNLLKRLGKVHRVPGSGDGHVDNKNA